LVICSVGSIADTPTDINTEGFTRYSWLHPAEPSGKAEGSGLPGAKS